MEQKYVKRSVNMEHMKNAYISLPFCDAFWSEKQFRNEGLRINMTCLYFSEINLQRWRGNDSFAVG